MRHLASVSKRDTTPLCYVSFYVICYFICIVYQNLPLNIVISFQNSETTFSDDFAQCISSGGATVLAISSRSKCFFFFQASYFHFYLVSEAFVHISNVVDVQPNDFMFHIVTPINGLVQERCKSLANALELLTFLLLPINIFHEVFAAELIFSWGICCGAALWMSSYICHDVS